MENASKALIIAGEILIGVVILSLAVYTFSMFGSYSKNINSQITESKINQFNVHFYPYEARVDISAQEIVSVINFANKSNQSLEARRGDDFFTDVCIDGVSVLDKDLNRFLEENQNSTFYSCNCEFKIKNIDDQKEKIIMSKMQGKDNGDIEYNKHTKLVKKINFNSISNETYANAILKGYNIEIQ